MNREIKFRAWDDKNKKWLLGYEYKNLGGFSLTGECVLFGEWGGVFDTFLFNKDGKDWNDLKIMQFTGLKDKNGVDIYEGDVLLYLGAKGSVFYKKETAMFMVNFKQNCSNWSFDSMDEEIIVIGNIYENPELTIK